MRPYNTDRKDAAPPGPKGPGFRREDLMNTEILRKVQEHIEQHPESLDMYRWPKCLAGWVMIFGQGDLAQWQIEYSRFDALRLPTQVLGISETEALQIFAATRWPSPYRECFRNAKTPQEKAKITVEFLEAFIQQQEIVTVEMEEFATLERT